MLKRAIQVFSLLPLGLLLTFLSYAQQPTSQHSTGTEVLTNSDIVKMVETKLGNDIIVSKISTMVNHAGDTISGIGALFTARPQLRSRISLWACQTEQRRRLH